MNAAIRTVVRLGINEGWEVFGVRNGYAGLLDQRIEPLGARDVGSILQRGGTVLGSARFPEWKEEDVRAQALSNLRDHRIEGLVVIGGNGSQTGAYALSQMGFPVVGVASTIDNDLACTETTIGVDTALNIALESIDRLRTTATSHKRAFVVEVMGRNCGYLALMAGIAGGAEAIVIPEAEVDPDDIAADLRAAYARGKPHALVVVAEGAKLNAAGLLKHFESNRGPPGIRHAGHHAWATCSAAARRGHSTGCWRRGCRRAPSNAWRGASTDAWWVSSEGQVRSTPLRDRRHHTQIHRPRSVEAGPCPCRLRCARPRTPERPAAPADGRRATVDGRGLVAGPAHRRADGPAGDRWAGCCCTCRWPAATGCGIPGRPTTPRSPGR